VFRSRTGSGGLRDFVLRGQCSVPTTAKALSLNVTVVFPTGSGFVRFSPSTTMPTASTINFGPGQTRANNAVLQLGNSDGVLTANALVTGGGTVQSRLVLRDPGEARITALGAYRRFAASPPDPQAHDPPHGTHTGPSQKV
jgi:hypothetical protein